MNHPWKRNKQAWFTAVLVICFTAGAYLWRYNPLTAASPSASYLPFISNQTPGGPANTHTWGSPIALTPDGQHLWVVNPDAGTVTVVETATLAPIAQLLVGQEPWSLAISPDGRFIYIADRARGELIILNERSHTHHATIAIGPELGHITLNGTGTYAYITSMSSHNVTVVAVPAGEIVARIPVQPRPYALAMAEPYLIVTHLTALPRQGRPEVSNEGRLGWLTVIDTHTNHLLREIPLLPNEQGFANLLLGAAAARGKVWLPHVRAMPDLPLSLTTTVFAAISTLDLVTWEEDTAAYLPLNDQEIFGSPVNNPVAAVPGPAGDRLYIVLAGSDLIEEVDVSDPHQPRLLRFMPAGNNPQGIVVSDDGRYGFVMSYLSRAVTVLDLATGQKISEVSVTAETLPPDIWRGKVLFNNASNSRLSQGSWISCASCHFGGWPDGVTWFFPDGPRQTPQLWNAGDTLPWHWSAALDEPQDVEETIERIQHGLGLAVGPEPPLLGTPNAGRSADLDALGSFLVQGIRPPALPPAEGDEVLWGRNLFIVQGCPACHGGAHWTSSALPGEPGTLDPNGTGMVDEVLQDVGTLNPLDVRGEMGFDPPSLLGVGLTAPYFHDGSMPTLTAVIESNHPTPDLPLTLNPEEITALVAFLHTLDKTISPVP